MVYKDLIKFETEKEYQTAKNYLRKFVNDFDGSCVLGGDIDHYETGTKDIKIYLHNQKFEISAECESKDDENLLERRLKDFQKNKIKGVVIFDGFEVKN
jgi:hypothetical protein